MRKTIFLMPLLAWPLLSCTSDDLERRVADNRAVTDAFMQSLKGALQAAMQEGGPLNAIDVCHEKAPAIAAELSTRQARRVARTSLKVRNPANAADEWEQNVLLAFAKRKARGEDPSTIEHYEMVRENDEWVFRYMKAIATGEVCLACHGEQIAPEVSARLSVLYPEDRATGYQAGDIRGAFTIIQPM